MSCIALYIHIPFCRRKCTYCSFVSYPDREPSIPAYLVALRDELKRQAAGKDIRTIYFGGGTPSLLSPEQFGEVLGEIRAICNVGEDAEITIEANPGTVDETYLSNIGRLGINRLSLGVQSFNDSELGLLGRIHTAREARAAVGFARAAGFTILSFDLMYGLPGQTLPNWRRTLETALDLEPEHLSLYGLTLEPEAPLYAAINRGNLPPPDPDTAAEQYELAEDLLARDGYSHYEISNWARPGFECRHNMAYWEDRPYLGIGVAAHSYLEGRRFANTSDLETYIHSKSTSPELDEVIGPELHDAESAILGLRLSRGITQDKLGARCRREIEEMIGAGLLLRNNERLQLTRRGRLLSNEVFWRLLPEDRVLMGNPA